MAPAADHVGSKFGAMLRGAWTNPQRLDARGPSFPYDEYGKMNIMKVLGQVNRLSKPCGIKALSRAAQ